MAGAGVLAAPRRARPRAAARPPAIRVTALRRDYGDTPVLEDVNFAVPQGLTLAVVGPNGAGKTTLLRVLAGLLRPTAGHVEILGHRLPADRAAVRSAVGVVGHETLLHPQLTCRENLRFVAGLFGLPPIRADELLDAFGLSSRSDEPVGTLSKGLRQRLACARACIHRPPVLLLDEPGANLDPAAARQMDRALAAHAGPTRVLITHDISLALKAADVLLALRPGRRPVFSERPAPSDLSGVYS